ncbi:unnamed protein product [Mucor hiemalis]
MSGHNHQSGSVWTTSGQSSSSTTSTRVGHHSTNSFSTLTYTDYVTSTISPVSSTEPVAVQSTSANIPSTSMVPDQFQTSQFEGMWEHRIHRFLPVILAFSIIGILTVLASLVYLAYRFYQANQASKFSRQRRRRHDAEEELNFSDENNNEKVNSPISATLSNIIPWLSIPSPQHPTDQSESYVDHQPLQREPIRYEKSDLSRIMLNDSNSSTRRPSFAPSWLIKILPRKLSGQPSKFNAPPRHMSLPILGGRTAIDNLNVPISSTFKPIDKSSLTLVPRSEIWQDPNRRRGVDELDMWERKQSGVTVAVPDEQIIQPLPLLWRFPTENVYPDSPESFERRFSVDRRRSIHIDSRNSLATTMQDYLPPLRKKPSMSRSKSESTRYDMDDNDDEDDETDTIANTSTSVSYPEALYRPGESSKEDRNAAMTVKIPKTQQRHNEPESSTSDVRMARNALEASRLKTAAVNGYILPAAEVFNFIINPTVAN